MLAVWHDEYEWYIAQTTTEAKATQAEFMGEDLGGNDFEKLPYWKVIGIYPDEDRQMRPRKLWAWVWILIRGRGFLATTEY